jgi:lipopolysaccharide/colanic/teichoic acid biosynthesis glycosyltransferase
MSELPTAAELNPYLFSRKKELFERSIAFGLMNVVAPLELYVSHKLGKDLDAGSPYFFQMRNGNAIYKWRTMNHRQATEGEHHPDGHHAIESFWESSSLQDERIPSSFAATVRKYRLDELAQFGQVALGPAGDGPPLRMTGIRPLADRHIEDIHQVASKVDPALADEWRDVWVPDAPQGAFSEAATIFASRQSNADFDPERDGLAWVTYDVNYCRTANSGTDIRLMQRTVTKLASMALAGGYDKLSSIYS